MKYCSIILILIAFFSYILLIIFFLLFSINKISFTMVIYTAVGMICFITLVALVDYCMYSRENNITEENNITDESNIADESDMEQGITYQRMN